MPQRHCSRNKPTPIHDLSPKRFLPPFDFKALLSQLITSRCDLSFMSNSLVVVDDFEDVVKDIEDGVKGCEGI
jgi:hypothetical protein